MASGKQCMKSSLKDDSASESSFYSELEEDSSSDEDNKEDIPYSESEDSKDEEKSLNHISTDRSSENNRNIKAMAEVNEYEFDSSDEEDLRNTIGNIPMEWYNDFPHIGYDWSGGKIFKPATGDQLDEFLKKIDEADYWRTVKDKTTGQEVLLTDEDLDIIQRIQKGRCPDSLYNMYEPFEDFISYEKMIHPVTNRPEHKRSFIPSKIEKEKVAKMVYAIKMGWIKPRKPTDDTPKYYMLWEDNEKTDITRRMQHYIPAPKMKLPGHEESYNPPPEYLFTKDEEKKWNEEEPEDRAINFIPQKYSCLRYVPAYSNFIRERFERCLDLYLCPRQRKMRMNVDPADLIPKLPKPKDLQPFPTIQSVIYLGHTDMVRCITVEHAGQFLASGSDDHTVKIWEVLTGRCLKTIKTEGIVKSISWCSCQAVCLLAVVINTKVLIINPGVGDKLVVSNTDALLQNPPDQSEEIKKEKKVVVWAAAEAPLQAEGVRLIVTHPHEVRQVTWHGKGDYFATVMPNAGNQSVIIHQLTTWRSQVPFQRSKGLVQCVLFHPFRPYFFVATQRYVKMYNLLKQELSKKLLTNCNWVSSIAVHPQGDNIIIGSYDSRLSWFDLDLSTKPYKTLRHHKKAIRQVAFHRRYPLFASASDDCSLIICHGMVYSDLLQNPLIVPVKILKGHKSTHDLGVLDCCFHPLQPWIFSSGSDGTVRLFT